MKLTLVIFCTFVLCALASPIGKENNLKELERQISEYLLKRETNGAEPQQQKNENQKPQRKPQNDDDSDDKDEEKEPKDKMEKVFEWIADKCGVHINPKEMPKPVKKEQIKALLQEVKGFVSIITKNLGENENIFAKAKELEDAEAVANTHKEAMDNFAKLGRDEVADKAFCLKVKAHILKYTEYAVGLDQSEGEFKGVPQCLKTCTLYIAIFTKTVRAIDFDQVPAAIQGDHACLKAGVEGIRSMAQHAQEKMDDVFILAKIDDAFDYLFTRGRQLHHCSMELHKIHSMKAKTEAAKKPEKPAERQMRELLEALDVYLKNH